MFILLIEIKYNMKIKFILWHIQHIFITVVG